MNLIRLVPISLIFLTLTACQHNSVRTEAPPSAMPPVEAQSPKVTAPAPTPLISPKPSSRRVALILGPGGAKTFAEVGVLKALQRERIPIGKIVGLEWGAMIGALYANKGQVNDLEWKLYKMEQQNLPRPKGFFGRGGDETVKVMDEYLAETFQREEVSHARIPFVCPTRNLVTGAVNWASHGFLKDIVRRCMAYPPTFKVDLGLVAAPSLATEAIEKLRGENFNVIILVNVLGSALPVGPEQLREDGVHVVLWQEIKRALDEASRLNVETISVDTNRYPVVQFEAQKELRQLGETAGQSAAAALISKYSF